jgi:hypothetical protein
MLLNRGLRSPFFACLFDFACISKYNDKMVELKSIEQLLYFMKGHIQLSRYDEKFIDNISTLITITTNQVVLLHRLIYKYRRQFAQHELFVEKLVDLPWNGITVVESSPQFTEGHVSLVDDIIYFRCPFNRNFIDEFRKIGLNSYVWNKYKRYYESPYNVYSLKILINTASKFFQTINLCTVTQSLLSEAENYKDIKYWQPTLVKRKGRLFIIASNSALDEVLGDLKLSTDAHTLLTLSKHGVMIDESFYHQDEKLKFASEYNTTVDQDDIPKLVDWLKEIECDMAFLSGVNSINISKRKLIEQLDKHDIQYCDIFNTAPNANKKYKCPIFVKFRKHSEGTFEHLRVSKIVTVVNSTPIEIK